ncbi:tyrosyl-DNA phosphodiesterase-domain-containing protein [Favolaschia claudopus]|uniref:Tyrosyl-DNA phosphodiesterase-domain-containing protein n=1 Tax=Favolaschia claudopus TaxID=2862362 RepID=A0AAW0DTL2_9AGAR
MYSDDDPDLARAIALSIKEAEQSNGHANTSRGTKKNTVAKNNSPQKKPKSSGPEVLVISSDEDEDDIVEVPAPREKGKAVSKQPVTEEAKSPAVSAPAGAAPPSWLNDRAQMERERLARQKRMRGPSPPPAPPGSESDDEELDDSDVGGSGSEGSARKRARLDSTGASVTTAGGTKSESGRRMFLDGALLRIDTKHADATIPNKPESIRLTEILGPKTDLAFAILSAFVVDPSWIYGFFDHETPVVLVTDPNTCGAEDCYDRPSLKNMFPHWVRVAPPLRDGRGCMHMKYMLLFSKSGGLRVVISSANLVPGDWRDVENYLFVQDISPAAEGKPVTNARSLEKPGESFPAMLARALRSTGVEEALSIMTRQGHTNLPLSTLLPPASARSKHGPSPTHLETRWDWSRVRAALVPSVAGKWEGWAGKKAVVWTGKSRLLRAIQSLGCSLEDGAAVKGGKSSTTVKGKSKAKAPAKDKWEIELDCLTSSIGTYTTPWIAVFRLCAAGRGHAVQEWLDRGRKKTPPQGPTRVLFPTLETVRGTVLGERGAGTVFCRRGQWVKISALLADTRSGLEMRDARSRSGNVGMHTKMILGTLRGPPEPESDTETDSDSEFASSDVEVIEPEKERRPHGWLYVGSHNFTASAWGTLSGSGFNPVLNVTNYELGVVLRLETAEDAAAAVAWEKPACKYGRGDLPWIQDECPFFQ